MSAWSWLDARAVAAWEDFASGPEAEPDRERFGKALQRPDWQTAYPPQVFTAEAAAETATTGLRLAELISGFPRRVFGDDLEAWAAYLGVPAEDAALMTEALRRPRLRRVATAFMRPDLVLTDDGLKLVELNVATSLGGLSTLAPYTAATRASAYAAFLAERGMPLDAPDTAKTWLEVFAGLVRARGAGPLRVFEATADPADLDGGRRFFVDMLRSAGHHVRCGLVTDLQLGDTGVTFEGDPIDAVFTAYTWHETKAFVPPALTRRLMELDSAGLVDFIGSPAAALYDNKGNLALLHDPEFTGLLTAEERALVTRSIPTTVRLRPDTLDRALADRDRLICKPASAYGGKNVEFGSALGERDWRTLLETRLADTDERYILQARQHPTTVRLPGAPSATERELVLAPLVFGGTHAGVFVRHAPARPQSTINASNGAEVAALLTVREE
ncbi:hypothetical protein NGF19_21675 [Streptomyces sp. RY43-2]|uniref:Circularly permuted type 2 ATP-grasp protein n=1 Tax=Streptomyces macrolidinus TaxID=2952607 RepID=A0ABT0ZIJ2_9ACTN|nr:hypothetical protein [Streptomyces macrolidinus]MCN9243360.1 hypothetical protein [Streptomyces macrolidinus]